MAQIDTGKEYGWLTVLGEGSRNKQNKRMVHVRCRCGREYDIQPAMLRRTEPKCRNCSNRVQMMARHGQPDYRFIITGSTAVGTLPSGDKFIIDTDDVPRVSQRHWYKKSDGEYILSDTRVYGKLIERIRLHRFIMGLDEGDERIVDHINRDSMDCRKSNMRIATQSQNCLNKGIRSDNTTGFIGVRRYRKQYCARICIAGYDITLGYSDDQVLCAQMYNHAATLLYGEFVGKLNDVPPASLKVKRRIEEVCGPYMKLSARVTEPLHTEWSKEVV